MKYRSTYKDSIGKFSREPLSWHDLGPPEKRVTENLFRCTHPLASCCSDPLFENTGGINGASNLAISEAEVAGPTSPVPCPGNLSQCCCNEEVLHLNIMLDPVLLSRGSYTENCMQTADSSCSTPSASKWF
jgi:hypothetical protein